MKQQAQNRRTTKVYKYKEKTYTLSELSLFYGIKASTIYGRIYKGWAVEKAVETPIVHHLKGCKKKNVSA